VRRFRTSTTGGFWARLLNYRPSAAMVVAMIALFVAMGGTTYAVKRLPKRSVGAAQLKKNAVRTKNIKARNVTRSRIAKKSIDSDLVGTDALVGKNILESSLGKVPSAKEADHAATADKVSGLAVQKFSFRVPAGTAGTNVLSLSGLALNAVCAAGSALSVTATTTVSGANIHSGGTWGAANQSFYVEDDPFDIGDPPFDILQDGTTFSSNLNGTLVYSKPDGGVVTVSYLAEETATGCVFAGSATG
jgi:hypothetical protein